MSLSIAHSALPVAWLPAVAALTLGLTASVWAQGWSDLAPMPTPRSEIHCAALGPKIYVAGGIGRLRTVDQCEVYDSRTNAWAQCPALPKPLHHIAMASVNKQIYASGGYVSLRFKPDNESALWALRPTDSHWTRISTLPSALGEHAMVSHNQMLYLIGGRSHGEDSQQIYAYDTSNHEWVTLPPMQIARHSFAAVVANAQIWILGGRSTVHGSKMTSVEIYDIATQRWRFGPELPVGGGGHAGVLLNDDIHLFGGEQFNPSRVIDRHHVLNLKSGVWRTESSLPIPRHGTAACTQGQHAIVIGGATQPGLFTVFSVSNVVQAWSANQP